MGPRPRRRAAVAAALTALGLVLSGCGSADPGADDGADGDPAAQPSASEASESPSPSPSESPSPSTSAAEPEGPYVPGNPQNELRPASAQEQRSWPTCGSVWQAGRTIPRAYEGCVRNGQNAVVADRIGCSFGGSMTTYADRYYGVVGNVVNDAGEPLSRSRAYERAYSQCSG